MMVQRWNSGVTDELQMWSGVVVGVRRGFDDRWTYSVDADKVMQSTGAASPTCMKKWYITERPL